MAASVAHHEDRDDRDRDLYNDERDRIRPDGKKPRRNGLLGLEFPAVGSPKARKSKKKTGLLGRLGLGKLLDFKLGHLLQLNI